MFTNNAVNRAYSLINKGNHPLLKCVMYTFYVRVMSRAQLR